MLKACLARCLNLVRARCFEAIIQYWRHLVLPGVTIATVTLWQCFVIGLCLDLFMRWLQVGCTCFLEVLT